MSAAERRTTCLWCSSELGAIVGDYCSSGCLQAERRELFNRPRRLREKWPRFSAEVPPELAVMLDEAQKRSLGINWRQGSRAGLVRSALLMYLDAAAPMPDPAIEGEIVEVVERPALGVGQPVCPVCGAENVEARVQTVTKVRPMGAPRPTPGVVAWLCAAGHWHDGERETGPPPEDVEIREGWS